MPDIVVVHAPESRFAGGGADIRVHTLTAALSERFDVRLLTVGPGSDIAADPTQPMRLRAMATGVAPRFTQRYDVRAAEAVRRAVDGARVVVAATLFVAPYLRDVPAKVVLDAHNVESEVVRRLASRHPSRARRAAYGATASWSRQWELGVARRVAQVWAVSAAEALWFRQAASDVVVVPNGVEIPAQPLPLVTEPTLIFVGSFASRFNRDGIEWFLRACWPRVRAARPDAALHLVGQGSEGFTGDGVVAHGFVGSLEDVYRRARVAVVPLLDGAGTRLKVLEAMALGKPVVATAIGAEGIELTPGRDAFIADDVAGFSEACLALLEDDTRAESIGAAGRTLTRMSYSWTHVGETAVTALRRLMSS